MSVTLQQTLRKWFGHTDFREHQRGVIETVLNKQSCMVVMATGAGKSLCYQLPVIHMRACGWQWFARALDEAAFMVVTVWQL